jgi:hypothetical protein
LSSRELTTYPVLGRELHSAGVGSLLVEEASSCALMRLLTRELVLVPWYKAPLGLVREYGRLFSGGPKKRQGQN